MSDTPQPYTFMKALDPKPSEQPSKQLFPNHFQNGSSFPQAY